MQLNETSTRSTLIRSVLGDSSIYLGTICYDISLTKGLYVSRNLEKLILDSIQMFHLISFKLF